MENINSSQEELLIQKLLKFGDKLKDLGLTPCARFFNLKTLQNPSGEFSVVEEGLNGIRASYERGELKLWFTNGFEDPNNETRKQVEEIWGKL